MNREFKESEEAYQRIRSRIGPALDTKEAATAAFTLSQRLIDMDMISDRLDPEPGKQLCISGTNRDEELFENSEFIGNGSFGTVHRTFIRGRPYIIKESKISKAEYRRLMLTNTQTLEVRVHRLLNRLVHDLKCPNFALVGLAMPCDECAPILARRNNNRTVLPHSKCSTLVAEMFDGDLHTYAHVLHYRGVTDALFESIFFQALYSLGVAQREFGLLHNDIRLDNILFKRIPPGGHWRYELDGRSYMVPNEGLVVALNDFGRAMCITERYSFDGNLSLRGVYVDPNGRVSRYTAKKQLARDENYALDPNSVVDAPSNVPRLFRGVDMQTSMQVDANDVERFPSIFMAWDVMDLLFSFIGGPSFCIDGDYTAMRVKSPSSTGVYRYLTQMIPPTVKRRYGERRMTELFPPFLYSATRLLKRVYKNRMIEPVGMEIERYGYPTPPDQPVKLIERDMRG